MFHKTLLQAKLLLAMRGQFTPQLRDREQLNSVLMSPAILEELQEHSTYQPLHEMAQQVSLLDIIEHMDRVVIMNIIFTTCIHSTTVVGADYIADNVELQLYLGDIQVCHTIDILHDNICEHPLNEFFFSDLAYVSGVQPITIAPPTAQVVIDDTAEPECEYKDYCIRTVSVMTTNIG